MKLNINILIPLLLMVSTMFASLLLYVKHDQEANKIIRKEALANMNLDITRLQNILHNQLTERKNNIAEARLNLSVTAMDTSIQTLLLATDEHSVIVANRYMWEGKQANTISDYDIDLAKHVLQNNIPNTFFKKHEDTLLTGYFPVVLQLENTPGLPVKRMGVLYIETSIATRLAFVRNRATVLSSTLAVAMLIMSLMVAYLLHITVSLRLTNLTTTVEKFAEGDLDTNISVTGNDELTVLSKAFKKMAKRIRHDIWRREEIEYNLKNLNETLEQRVKKRTKELEFKKQELLDSQSRAHHANKMTALGEMASGIAHEINSPLQVISILTYKIKKALKKEDSVVIDEATDKIDRATLQITSIVESLRMMSRDSSSDPFESIKISTIIDDATSITIERYKLNSIIFKINYHGNSQQVSITCQRLQVSQIIINLLNNAFDAVNDQIDKWITLDVYDFDNHITISVTDNGQGIKDENKDKIFTPMFTTKDIGKGTGLGLSISSEIAMHHGGSLSLDTESKHTRFILALPKQTTDKQFKK